MALPTLRGAAHKLTGIQSDPDWQTDLPNRTFSVGNPTAATWLRCQQIVFVLRSSHWWHLPSATYTRNLIELFQQCRGGDQSIQLEILVSQAFEGCAPWEPY